MPPSADSKHEQIAARLETIFEAVAAGSKYWFTPAKVARVDGFWDVYFDPSAVPVVAGTRTIYLLRPGDERKTEDTDSEIKREMDVWLCVAQVFDPVVTKDPYVRKGTAPWTIQSRLVQDVENAVYAAAIQAGAPMGISFVENLEIPDTNRQYYCGDAWIAVEFRLLVTYTHVADQV